MARERAVRDGDDAVGTDAEPATSGGKQRLLTRRSYLGIAGGALAVGVGVAASPASAADDFEVIEARGQTIEIGDGETFENKLIDFSTGECCLIYARESTGWTIRNVGFTGTHEVDTHAIAVADVGGGTSTIENVYLGDGCVRPAKHRSHGQCAIWVAPEHTGHIDIRHCNIQEWPNNGIYASAPGGKGGGTVHIDSCYAANNYVSSYRLGSDGSKVTNSVAFNDGQGRYSGRCFWGWPPGELEVSTCHFDSGPYDGAIHVGRDNGQTTLHVEESHHDGINERGNVEVVEDDVGSDPDLSLPAGVPTSAEDAAGG